MYDFSQSRIATVGRAAMAKTKRMTAPNEPIHTPALQNVHNNQRNEKKEEEEFEESNKQ